jgi:hypothetical protein
MALEGILYLPDLPDAESLKADAEVNFVKMAAAVIEADLDASILESYCAYYQSVLHVYENEREEVVPTVTGDAVEKLLRVAYKKAYASRTGKSEEVILEDDYFDLPYEKIHMPPDVIVRLGVAKADKDVAEMRILQDMAAPRPL